VLQKWVPRAAADLRAAGAAKTASHDTDAFFMLATICRGSELNVLKYSPPGSGRIHKPLLRADEVIE